MTKKVEELVLYEKIALDELPKQYLGLVTLNRPNDLNPLDWDTFLKLKEVLENMASDVEVRVIAITGNGKAFSAGGDLKRYKNLQKDEQGFREFLRDVHSTFNFIEKIEKPVIGLINGYCVAGGFELVLACDFAYAAESAKIGDGHINYGQMGGGGSLSRIVRRIHPSWGRELLFTGKLISAQEAMEWGIVNRVVPDGKLIEAALECTRGISRKSPLALKNMKRVVNRALKMREEDAIALECEVTHHYCVTSFDAQEGLAAFAEKRSAKYKGV